MTTTVRRWGNSLAVRIPRSVALDACLASGAEVDMRLREGAIVIVPMRGEKYHLEDLLKGIGKHNLHGEIPTGPAVGSEVW